MGHSRRRIHGVTLIETLIVIGLIGLLAAILLPALQSARESSRRLSCRSNLRQIGLATHAYALDHRSYPYAGGLFSATQHLSLLPYLENAALFHAWNFEHFEKGMDGRNRTCESVTIQTFLCPSDSSSEQNVLLNYPANHHFDVRSRADCGLFSNRITVNPSMVTDGASNTAFFGEFVSGIGQIRAGKDLRSVTKDLRRPTFWVVFEPGERQDQSAAEIKCHSVTLTSVADGNYAKGLGFWGDSTRPRAGYDHHTAPNTTTCLFDPSHLRDDKIVPVSSMHSGGAHVVFGDGHVSYVRNEIQVRVWGAIGTRAGGEPISNNDY